MYCYAVCLSLICMWTTSLTILCGPLIWVFLPRMMLTQWPKGLLRNMSEDKTPFRAALRRRRRPLTAPIPTPSTPSRFAWVNFSLSQYLGYYLTLYFATNSFNRINKSSELKCCYVAFGFWPLNNDQHSQLFAILLLVVGQTMPKENIFCHVEKVLFVCGDSEIQGGLSRRKSYV